MELFSLGSNSAACSSAVRKPAISLADSTDLRYGAGLCRRRCCEGLRRGETRVCRLAFSPCAQGPVPLCEGGGLWLWQTKPSPRALHCSSSQSSGFQPNLLLWAGCC